MVVCANTQLHLGCSAWSATCRQPLLQQQQQQQLTLAAPQDNYLASRNEALHNVESAIRDIGGIFQQLAHMVWLSTLFLAESAWPSMSLSHISSDSV